MPELGAVEPLPIATAAHALLDAVLVQLNSATVAGVPWQEPTRVGFVPGALLAYDDDQLTVNWLTVPLGMPGHDVTESVTPFNVLLYYTFSITLVRKVHVVTGAGTQGGIPTTAQLDADAVAVSTDAALLLAAVQTIRSESLLVTYGTPFAYGPLTSVGPEGGLAGSRIAVEFQAGCSIDGTF
ncbi:MAG: hypothetical protein KGH75_00090 [Rhodospirillales bacterium]|nr:hypothetical protein [Rhodospirillales bacterium]